MAKKPRSRPWDQDRPPFDDDQDGQSLMESKSSGRAYVRPRPPAWYTSWQRRRSAGQQPSPRHDLNSPSIGRRVKQATRLRHAVIDHLRASAVWPPVDPQLLYILTLNLASGADVTDGWGEDVLRARHAFSSELRSRNARLKRPNWDAQTQVNAFNRVMCEQLIKDRSEPDKQRVWEAAREVASSEVRRIAAQQRFIRTPAMGRPPKLRSIVDGWNPRRRCGRYPAGDAAWLWLRIEVWCAVRHAAMATKVANTRQTLAELLVTDAIRAGVNVSPKQRSLVTAYQDAYERIVDDRGHTSDFSEPQARSEAMLEAALKKGSLENLASRISKIGGTSHPRVSLN